MAKGKYVEFPMIVEDVTLGLISTTEDVIERFNISDTVVNAQIVSVNRKRKAHERKIYSNANDTTAEITTNVAEVIKAYIPQKRRTNAGKKIKVDTGLRSIAPSVSSAAAAAPNAGTIRYATMNFPSGVSNYQVARWLTVNIPDGRRPNHFVTPAGVRQRVAVTAAPAQTTGEGEGAGAETP